MKIALIPPASLFGRSFGRKYQMLLPACAELPECRMFYSEVFAGSNEYYTILDNGAFETASLTPSDLLQMASEFNVDEVVAPDTLCDGRTSLNQLAQFMSLCRHPSRSRRRPAHIMTVVQGTNLEQCKEYIGRVARYPEVTTIGIPKHLPKTVDNKYVRLELVRFINTHYPSLWNIHFLGYIGLDEIRMAAELGVRSLDTSAPFICAANGSSILMGVPERQDDYFHLPAEKFDGQPLDMNIRQLDRAALCR